MWRNTRTSRGVSLGGPHKGHPVPRATLAGVKVLVIGGGAREHALCRSLSLDPDVTALHCAPGNAGIAEVAELHPVDQLDGAAVTALATELGADLVVVGPEAPLVAGVADAVRAAGIPVFGPSREAARLEGSKAFAKDVMAGAGVPTARSYVCTTPAEIDEALDAFGAPYVVKDDGLAAGKGVVVTDDVERARAHALACDRVVIEEYLDGPEVSLFAITDGTTVLPLKPAQDFKRALDGDEGPNTGGMGAYSPLPWADPKLVEEVLETVLQPTVDELRRRGTPFSGLLYAGLAITGRGVRVIEFNARFGDPETQVVLARLKTPLAGVLLNSANGTLDDQAPLALERRGRRHRGRGLPQLPGDPAHGRPDRGPGRGRREGRPARVRAPRRYEAGRRRGRQRGRPGPLGHRHRNGPGAGPRAGVRGGRPHPP